MKNNMFMTRKTYFHDGSLRYMKDQVIKIKYLDGSYGEVTPYKRNNKGSDASE